MCILIGCDCFSMGARQTVKLTIDSKIKWNKKRDEANSEKKNVEYIKYAYAEEWKKCAGENNTQVKWNDI